MKKLLLIFILVFSQNIYSKSYLSDLTSAVVDGNFFKVRELILRGSDVNAKDGNGVTALQYSTVRNQLFITTLLLVNGAEVDVRDYHYFTPLMSSVNTHRSYKKICL